MKKIAVSIFVIISTQSAFAANGVCEKAALKAVYTAEMKQKKQDKNYTFDIGDVTTTREPQNGKMGIYEVEYTFNEECVGGYTVGAKPSDDGQSCNVIFVREVSVDGACG